MPAISVARPPKGAWSTARYGSLPDPRKIAWALQEAYRAANEGDADKDRRADEDAQFKGRGRRNVDGVARFGDRVGEPSTTAQAAPADAPFASAGDNVSRADVAEGEEEDVPMELSTEADVQGGPTAGTDDNGDEPAPPGTSAGPRCAPVSVASTSATGAPNIIGGAASASASAAPVSAEMSAAAAAAEAAAERWRQLWTCVPSRWERVLRPEAAPPPTPDDDADEEEEEDQLQQQETVFPPGFGLLGAAAPEPRRRKVEMIDIRKAYEGGGSHKLKKEAVVADLAQIPPTSTASAAMAAVSETRPVPAPVAPSAPPGASRQALSAVKEEPPAAVDSRSVAAMAMQHGKGRASAASGEQAAAVHRPLGKASAAGERATVRQTADATAAAAAEPTGAPSGQEGPEEETEEAGGSSGPQGVGASGSRGRQEGAGGRRAAAGPTATAAKRQRTDDVSLRGVHTSRDIGFAGRRTSPWVQTGAASEVEPSAVVGSETGAGTVVGSETGVGACSVGGVPRASPPPPQLLVGEAGEGEAVDLPLQQQLLLPSLPRRTLPAPWLLHDTSVGGGGGSAAASAAGSSSERHPPLLPTALMGADMALLDQLLPAISAANSAGGVAVGAGEGGLLPRLLQGLSALQVRFMRAGCVM